MRRTRSGGLIRSLPFVRIAFFLLMCLFLILQWYGWVAKRMVAVVMAFVHRRIDLFLSCRHRRHCRCSWSNEKNVDWCCRGKPPYIDQQHPLWFVSYLFVFVLLHGLLSFCFVCWSFASRRRTGVSITRPQLTVEDSCCSSQVEVRIGVKQMQIGNPCSLRAV